MRLMDYLPACYRGSPQVTALQEAMDGPVAALRAAQAAFLEQLDVETAGAWGLALWETWLGLAVEVGKPADYRRSRIRAKLRGQGTTTAELMRNVAESFSNGAVRVTELPAEYRVEVEFVDAIGLPPNLDDLKRALGEIVPAHLAIHYLSTLKTWDDVAGMTWDDAGKLTWEQFKGGSL